MSNPSFSNIDQWLFELNEGNLSPEQIAQLEFFLMQHPELDVDLDMWQLSVVTAEPLIYPYQDKLEKKRPVFWYWAASSAAILALFIGGSYLMNTQNITSSKLISAITNTIGELNGAAETFHGPNQSSTQTNESINEEPISNSRDLTTIVETIQNIEFSTVENNCPFSGALVQSNDITSATSNSDVASALNFNFSTSFQDNASSTLEKMKMRRHQFSENKNRTLAKLAQEEKIEDWTLHRKSAKNKSSNAGFSFADMKRAIQKMVDNPIALKNLKDPHYHVPGMQAADINFGAVGTLLATRVQTNTRYQWMGQSNDQLSNSLLIDGYAYAIRGGIGLQINQSTYHNNGYQNTYAAITYSPKLSINKNITLEPAFRFKMGNQRINPTKLPIGQKVEFDRQNAQQFYSENEAPIGKAMWYKDFGMSVMMNTKWFYAGVQFDNLGRHQNNIYGSSGTQRAGVQSIITIGTDYESQNHKLGFSPYLVYQNYEKLSEAWLGANFRASWFTVGAAISSNAEPAASLGVKFKHFALTYNADYTQSMITQNKALSHQLTLRFLTNPSRVGQRLLNY